MRGVWIMLTRDAILGANFVEYILRGASATVVNVVETLLDCYVDAGAGGNVEEPLIGFGILDYGFCFAIDG